MFGVDIFSGFPTSFDYYDDIPLTGDYVLRNGDKIKISAFGNLEIEEVITIDREGKLNIPQVGSIQISGQAFDMAYDNITAFISNRFIGTELIITLDQVRAKKIFVMGNEPSFAGSGWRATIGWKQVIKYLRLKCWFAAKFGYIKSTARRDDG